MRLYTLIFILSVVFVFLISGEHVHAQMCTLFVAANGSDTNSGTITQPFKTIQKAANVVKAGDVVCVRAGTYPAFDIRGKAGTASNPIVFQPYQGEKVIIDRYLGGGNGFRAIEFYGGSYITIDDFEVTDSDPNIDLYGYCNPRIDSTCSSKIESLGFRSRNGIKVNASETGAAAHHLVFQNLKIHHNIGMAILVPVGIHNNIRILNNQIYNNGGANEGYGMYVTGDSHLIRGNISHDNKGGHGLRFGTQQQPLTNSIIEQNISYNNGGTFVHSSPTTPIVTDGDGIIIYFGNNNSVRNNISYNNDNHGIRIFGGNPTNNLVANNTVYNNGAYGIYVDGGIAEGGRSPGINTAKNNIVYKNGLNPFDGVTGKSLGKVEEFSVRAGGIKSNNLIGTDPKFVNVSSADFHLQASSPAIDAGTAISQVTVDFAGTPRPQGSAYDIGAYEFIGQAAPPPPPPSPKPPAPTPPPTLPPPPAPVPLPSPQSQETSSPLSASNLTAKQDGRSVIIYWKNPDHLDWKRSFLVKSKGEAPDFPHRGKVIYEGVKPEFIDRDLQPGQTYFYAVYTVSKTGSQSEPAITEIQFEEVREAKTGDTPFFQKIWKWFISLFGF